MAFLPNPISHTTPLKGIVLLALYRAHGDKDHLGRSALRDHVSDHY